MSLLARAVNAYRDEIADRNDWLRSRAFDRLENMLGVISDDVDVTDISGTASPPWLECTIDTIRFRVEVHTNSDGDLDTKVQLRHATALTSVKSLVDVGRLMRDEPIPGDDLAEWPVADEPEAAPA